MQNNNNGNYTNSETERGFYYSILYFAIFSTIKSFFDSISSICSVNISLVPYKILNSKSLFYF